MTDSMDAARRLNSKRVIVWLLAVWTVASLLVRVPAIAEPLGIDQSLWASAVRAMAHGQSLYRDVWDQKPPGLFFAYWAAFTTFGWTSAAVAWLDILAATATVCLLFLIGRRLADSLTGALAASLYAAFTMPAWLYRNGGFLERSVAETFISVLVAAAAWSLIRSSSGSSIRWTWLAGLFAGATIVFKPNAGAYIPVLACWYVIYAGRQASRRQATVAIGTGALTVPALVLVWLGWQGTLTEAYIAVIDFGRYYVADGFSPAHALLELSRAAWSRVRSEPVWAAGTIASLAAIIELGKRRRLDPLPALGIAWGAATVVVILANGVRLFNSYFIQVLPPLALLGAWAIAGLWRRDHFGRAVGFVTALAVVVLAVERHYPVSILAEAAADVRELGGRGIHADYLNRFGGYANNRGYSARANEELAAYVRQHTDADDRVFLFGINGAGVYFAADRLPAHRFLRVNFFVPEGYPNPRFTLEAVAHDLSQSKARLLIFETLHASSEMASQVDALRMHPALQGLLAQYQLAAQIEDFAVYERVPGR